MATSDPNGSGEGPPPAVPGGEGEEAEDEVFMPEQEGEVVADLEGQASDDEDEDEEMELEMGEGGEGEGMAEDFVVVERDDACACLVTGPAPAAAAAETSGAGGSAEAEASAEPKPVYTVKWNKSDASVVACGGEDDRVRLWKPFHSGGPNSITLDGHEDSVVALDFDATGKALASGGMDGRVIVWSTATGRKLSILEGPGEAVEFVKWHPVGNVVLAGSEDMTMWMWSVDLRGADAEVGKSGNSPSCGQCMQVFTGHNQSVTCGGFTPDGKTIVSSSLDGTVKVWNPKTGECKHTFSFQDLQSQWAVEEQTPPSPDEVGITCLDFSPDSSMVLCGGIDCAAHLININNNRVLWKLGRKGNSAAGVGQVMPGAAAAETTSFHEDSVETVAFHPAGQPLVATGSLDGKLIIWDANTSTPRLSCAHPRGVIRVQWVKSGPTHAGGAAVAAGASVGGGQEAFQHLHDLCLYTCCLDGRVRLWDARSGQCLREFQGFTKSLLDMDLAPGGRSIVAGSDDGTARVFSH